MSDKQFTFFELHFHDGVQLGPRTLGDGELEAADGDAVETATEPEPEPTTVEPTDSGPSVLGSLFGLGLLAAAAYAVRKLLAGEPEGLDALDDIEAEAEDHAEDLQAEAEDSVPIEITSPEEEESGGIALVAAAAVGLLVILALAARKLLGASEEIVVEE